MHVTYVLMSAGINANLGGPLSLHFQGGQCVAKNGSLANGPEMVPLTMFAIRHRHMRKL